MMKRLTLIGVLLLSVAFSSANAQTMKEKLAAKKAALEAKLNESLGANMSKAVDLDPNVSQSEIAAKWEDKEYTKFSRNGEEDGSRKIKITKEDGKVTAIWIGEVKYLADEHGKSDFVRYYKTTGSGHYKVAFLEEKILVFTTTTSGQFTSKYSLNKKASYEELKSVIAYIDSAKVNQTADLELYAKNQKASSDKAFEEKKAKWSIEGKKVTKIEVTDIVAPYSFGYYRPFNFQVKATLANGKTISTKDGGFWSDYKITYKNGDVKSKTIQDTKFIKGDKIVVEVVSKFDGSIKATGDVVMDYSENLTMGNNANNWGESAANYKVEVKQEPHAVTGKPVLLFKVTDYSGYQKTLYFKMDANKTLNFFTNGHNGCKTAVCQHGEGPGGNGGNITVIKDPSVTSFNINYTMNGGIGGAGTYGYNRGRDGRDGTYKEEVRTVNF